MDIVLVHAITAKNASRYQPRGRPRKILESKVEKKMTFSIKVENTGRTED
jgi:hypothetical protein